jgi:hypothetical protein
MAKVMNAFGIGSLAVTVIAILFFMQHADNARTPTTVTIGAVTIAVDVADSPSERAQGLSGRATLQDGQGMLFMFDTEGTLGIWMKDMQFALDIIWADRTGTIITIARNVSPDTYPQAFYAAEPRAVYVLEVPAGFTERQGIVEGAKLVVQ